MEDIAAKLKAKYRVDHDHLLPIALVRNRADNQEVFYMDGGWWETVPHPTVCEDDNCMHFVFFDCVEAMGSENDEWEELATGFRYSHDRDEWFTHEDWEMGGIASASRMGCGAGSG